MFEGMGKLKLKNGNYYLGHWKNNMKNGVGYQKTDQFEYLGEFQDNKLIGKALFICRGENKQENQWEE